VGGPRKRPPLNMRVAVAELRVVGLIHRPPYRPGGGGGEVQRRGEQGADSLFRMEEAKEREQALLALGLTEKILALLDVSQSPTLDWTAIAQQLAPHQQPAPSPRECHELWCKLTHRDLSYHARYAGGGGGGGEDPMVTTSGTSGADQESGMASEESAQQKLPRKRTMWTNEEDMLLLRGVRRNGEGNWAAILREQPEGSVLLRRNSTQLAQRWNAIKRKIQRGHYAGLDETTKTLATELVGLGQTHQELKAGSVSPEPPLKLGMDEPERSFQLQAPSGPSCLFD